MLSEDELEQVRTVVAEAIASAAQPIIERAARQAGAPQFALGTVEAVTVDGLATVTVDGDDTTVLARTVGAPPPERARCLLVFVPSGGLYCLGLTASARLRLPTFDLTSLTGEDHALQIGSSAEWNVCIDHRGMQARDNGTEQRLNLQDAGGVVRINQTLALGAPDAAGDYAGVGHADLWTTAGAWAVRQTGGGTTNVNAPDNGAAEVRVSFSADTWLALKPQAGTAALQATLPHGLAVQTSGTYYTVLLQPDGSLVRTSSRRADKEQITDIARADANALLEALTPVRYKRPGADREEWGFIADDSPEPASMRDADGNPLDIDVRSILAAVVAVLRPEAAQP